MKNILITATLAWISILSSSWGAVRQPVDEVLPFVGTGGHGHTFPGATVPFGLVQLSPDTRTHDWDACAGYHYSDKTIMGFSHTHLSGTGIREYGNLLVLPMTGALNEDARYKPLEARRFVSGFSHDKESAQPGYYQVMLDKYNIKAELTATPHAGMHRYTFPASQQSHVLLDLVHGLENRPTAAGLKVEHDNLLTGYRRSDGWGKNLILYFAIECSQPFKSIGLELDGKPLSAGVTNAEGKQIRAHLDYETSDGQQILLRVGLSPTSVEEARKNLAAEIPSWDFDSVREAAQATWNEQLSRVKIESPNPNIRQTFYTAFYHAMLAPTLYNDADGSYRGPDGAVHSAGFQYYSTFSLWDTFRAQHPLLTLTHPERVNDFVQSLLVFSQQSPGGVLPMWSLGSYDTGTMIGYHAIPVIRDAYAKGFRGFDAELAFAAMRKTATSGRNRQDEYQKFGFVPWVEGKRKATSQTLEFAYDDWCVAQMAAALGKTNDAALFSQRARNYRNVWDAQTRFFRSKNEDGNYQEGFNPKQVSGNPASGYYVEANAWQYTFFVPHDVPGMMELYGGREAFISRLDEFFNQDSDVVHWGPDITGLIGQYAHGNEPCHHVAYLYALAGAQYKTALRARQIMTLYYDNTPEGICGNDDCGQMSAWYVWSAMGLYPVNSADGKYVIGSPMVEKATIKLDSKFYPGGAFTVTARNVSNQNIYIQSAKLNGKPLNRPWITHEEIACGGTLEFEMGVLPNKAWGIAEN
ncbi:MAG: putative alpha,2-mannosidase [Pedosphaera sp.]|nr:putative alpha,2-mannosidase [Pedosphaera sp.]